MINFQKQQGQTLIETLVAAFILVMGITAALSLASYSLSATGSIKQQAVGIGLAREGIEVVKNMRDTNWLRGTLFPDCYDFLNEDPVGAYCYQDWLKTTGGYNIKPNAGGPTDFIITFHLGQELPWSIDVSNSFGLDLYTDPTDKGTYYVPSLGSGNSGFSRKITIEEETDFEPFNTNIGGRLKVTSTVWWTDKKCGPRSDVAIGEPCSVSLVTYLTNWRNF